MHVYSKSYNISVKNSEQLIPRHMLISWSEQLNKWIFAEMDCNVSIIEILHTTWTKKNIIFRYTSKNNRHSNNIYFYFIQ